MSCIYCCVFAIPRLEHVKSKYKIHKNTKKRRLEGEWDEYAQRQAKTKPGYDTCSVKPTELNYCLWDIGQKRSHREETSNECTCISCVDMRQNKTKLNKDCGYLDLYLYNHK